MRIGIPRDDAVLELPLHRLTMRAFSSKGGTMAEQVAGKRVAALVTKGFEQVELFEPRQALTRRCRARRLARVGFGSRLEPHRLG